MIKRLICKLFGHRQRRHYTKDNRPDFYMCTRCRLKEVE